MTGTPIHLLGGPADGATIDSAFPEWALRNGLLRVQSEAGAPSFYEVSDDLKTARHWPTGHIAWSFVDMVLFEPRLGDLADLANRGGDARDWMEIKRQLETLVGWSAADPRLTCAGLFDTAYAALLRLFENAGGRF